MTTKEKFGLLLGIPSWIPERYKGVHILGAAGVLLGMILSGVLFPQAGIIGEIVGLLVGYYVTLGLVLTVGIRPPWLAQFATSNSVGMTINVVFGFVSVAFGVVGVFAYIDTREPIMIFASAFGWFCGIVLFKRARRSSSRA